MIDHKALLCQIIEDFGGELIIDKSALGRHHVLHYYEDEDTITLTSEEKLHSQEMK